MARQIKKTTIKPYRDKLNSLDLRCKEFSIDQDVGDEQHIYPERKLINLDEYKDYDKVNLELSLDYAESDMRDLIPDTEQNNPPLKFVIIIRGSRTSVRKKKFEKDLENYDSGDNISIELSTQNYRGKVKVKPFVVRTETKETPETYAHRKSTKIASGREITLRFDEFEDLGNSGLNVVWKNFSEDDSALPLSEDMLYHLSLDESVNPVLRLNSDKSEIKNLMNREGTRGLKPRVRDVFFNSIIVPVHIELITEAVTKLDEDSLEFDYEWQEAIVMDNIERILYDKDLADKETRLDELINIRQKDDGLRRIISRVQIALQEKEKPLEIMQKMVNEVN